MKWMFTTPLFLLPFYCAIQTLGVKIQSNPVVNGEGVVEIELDKTVSLLCLSDDNSEVQDNKELVWLRNEAMVILKDGNKKGNSSLCVTPVIHDDNGATFTCRLSTNATDKASVTLNVTYGPQLSGSDDVTAEEESMLVLQCDIWANPPVSTVMWKLNGSAVDLLAGGFTVSHSGHTSKLTANSVEKSLHEGTYQCTTTYMHGERSRSFHVTVTDKTIKFPLIPIIAGVVVVCLTALLAVASRWKKIIKCCK